MQLVPDAKFDEFELGFCHKPVRSSAGTGEANPCRVAIMSTLIETRAARCRGKMTALESGGKVLPTLPGTQPQAQWDIRPWSAMQRDTKRASSPSDPNG